MAGRKFTRSGARKSPLKGGNRIRTHPSRGRTKRTEESTKAADVAADTIRRARHPLSACASLLRDIRQELDLVNSHVVIAAAALKAQNAEHDSEIADVLRRSVGDALFRRIELLDRLLDDDVRKGDAP